MNHSYSFQFKDALLGFQHLTIAMGALVLVPLLTGMDPSVALFTAGAGTLLFQWITRGQIPIFLGSSFAFVPATLFGIQHWGLSATLCGLALGAVAYFAMSLLIYQRGKQFVDKILPPIVTGPVIAAIGLVLAPTAINMAMGKSGDGSTILFDQQTALVVAFAALTSTIITRLFAPAALKLIPLLIGVVIGYAISIGYGIVDFNAIKASTWFHLPEFTMPTWNWHAVWLIMPIALVSAMEHIGDIFAISAVTKQPYTQNPGLPKSLFANGLASCIAALIGGPPNTTYSEVTAGVALTRRYNPGILTWTALGAILLAFVGKFGACLQSIPSPVMGGILILLFGAIAVTGLSLVMESGEDIMEPRNMTIMGIILVLPIGGMSIGAGDFALEGIGLGGLAGVLLNAVLPHEKPLVSNN